MKTKIETVMTDVCDDNDMLINDVLMYLIQRNFAILDMSYDQPNERYIINMIRPRDLNQYENDNVDNKNIYKSISQWYESTKRTGANSWAKSKSACLGYDWDDPEVGR